VSGTLLFLVRAEDSDGNEESNIEQMIKVALSSGSEVGIPAEPRLVEVDATGSGTVTVKWLYDPYYETNGPGVADEARIYWDGGTGTMDWSSPKATVSMGGPTSSVRKSWESGTLTDGTAYQFAVRIASSDGVETDNKDTYSATAASDLPETPELSAEVV